MKRGEGACLIVAGAIMLFQAMQQTKVNNRGTER